jgi:hypothetical protein
MGEGSRGGVIPSEMPERAEKPCVVCGRRIQWRKKWERDWEGVKYCSDRCRQAGTGPVDSRLEAAILALLANRATGGKKGEGATICPSEAARAVAGEAGWRELMEPARAAARRLVAKGQLEITQGGRVVDPSTARGAIRLRLKRGGS